MLSLTFTGSDSPMPFASTRSWVLIPTALAGAANSVVAVRARGFSVDEFIEDPPHESAAVSAAPDLEAPARDRSAGDFEKVSPSSAPMNSCFPVASSSWMPPCRVIVFVIGIVLLPIVSSPLSVWAKMHRSVAGLLSGQSANGA